MIDALSANKINSVENTLKFVNDAAPKNLYSTHSLIEIKRIEQTNRIFVLN